MKECVPSQTSFRFTSQPCVARTAEERLHPRVLGDFGTRHRTAGRWRHRRCDGDPGASARWSDCRSAPGTESRGNGGIGRRLDRKPCLPMSGEGLRRRTRRCSVRTPPKSPSRCGCPRQNQPGYRRGHQEHRMAGEGCRGQSRAASSTASSGVPHDLGKMRVALTFESLGAVPRVVGHDGSFWLLLFQNFLGIVSAAMSG